MSEPIVIILQTYQRTDYARRTIKEMIANFDYPRHWYVADDGSPTEHVEAVLAALSGEHVVGWHSEKLGYGGNSNRAWDAAHQHADITLWLEDDWELRRQLNPTRYAELLHHTEGVGMVRLGHLAVGLRAEVSGYDGAHYLTLHKSTQYTFSGNPGLRHRRFLQAYGYYPVGPNPGDTEIAYDAHIRSVAGPDIVWPVDIGGWGLFGHIGEIKSYDPAKG